MLRAIVGRIDSRLRFRAAALFLVVGIANLAAWVWAGEAFRGNPVLMGTALLAYGLGLRHAVDADHIAAIDNVTRKLIGDGRRPLATGLYFSCGHAAVVALASLFLATTGAALSGAFSGFHDVGVTIGPLISTAFLIAIAAMNFVILAATWRAYRSGSDENLVAVLNGRGILTRLFRPLFRIVRHSWQMLLVGALFGLGFDTATEIGVLGLSAAQGSSGMTLWSIMVFPSLFAAGMALIDTADGILMVGAYGWALRAPRFKFAYNMAITLASAVVALAVGVIEVVELIGTRFDFDGTVWHLADAASANFETLGLVLVGGSATAWFAAWAFSRLRPRNPQRIDLR
jgi:nickel/cobalt transporter (NiCoT) family protein